MSSAGDPGRGGGAGADTTDLPRQIDRYEIRGRLGRGGQGEVLLAYDPHLDLDVAIKVLHGQRGDAAFADRFAVEARTAARLTHPHIVRIYDYNPRVPYIVMEYCDGGDLTELIKRRRPRPLREVLDLMAKLADALAIAHANEPPILHRDLKPANVLFHRGEPKVADFGLAKMLGAGQGLTTVQGMMGTVRYMSPEQCLDSSVVDHRTDVWSLGVMLYELLTWTRPFDKPGDNFVNVALRIRIEPPRTAPWTLTAPVAAILDRALAKNAADRYASARELGDALVAAAADLGGAGDEPVPPESAVGELDRLAAESARLLDDGATAAAGELISRLRKEAPEDSLGRFWLNRLRTMTSSVGAVHAAQQRQALELGSEFEAVGALIDRGAYREARSRLGAVLAEHPDSSIAQRLLNRAIADEERAAAPAPEPEPELPPVSLGAGGAALVDLVGRAQRELRRTESAAADDTERAARAALEQAVAAAVAALARPDAGGAAAPEELDTLRAGLDDRLSAWEQASRGREERAAAELAAARREAETQIGALEAAVPAGLAVPGGDAQALRAELTEVVGPESADVTVGTSERAAIVRSLAARARAAALTAAQAVRDDLERLCERAALQVLMGAEARLGEVVGRVRRGLDPALLTPAPEDLARLHEELHRALAAAERHRDDALERAAADWRAALARLERAGPKGPAARQLERDRAAGEQALRRGDAEGVAGWAARLEAEAEEAEQARRLGELMPVVERAEQAADEAGAWPELHAARRALLLEPAEIDARLRSLDAGPPAPQAASAPPRPVTRRGRELWRRAAPALVEHHDSLGRAERVDDAALAAAARRLPAAGTGWTLVGISLAASLLVVLAALWSGVGFGTTAAPGASLALVAPGGVTVTGAFRGDEPVPELVGPWTGTARRIPVPPGTYRLETSAGERRVTVDGPTVLLLAQPEEEAWGALLDALAPPDRPPGTGAEAAP